MTAPRLRTKEDIMRYLATKGPSGLDWDKTTLLVYLSFEEAKSFIGADFNKDDWRCSEYSHNSVVDEMKEYMDFAWNKVEGHRGLSADRAVQRMQAWLWLLGDDKTLAKVKAAGYTNYGAPKLAVVCRKYKFPIPRTRTAQNMIKGRRCGATYGCGCG